MRMPLGLPHRLLRARARHRVAPMRATRRPAVAVAPLDDHEAAAHDRLLRELAAGALLVQRGVATRVVVANEPGVVDLDEVRLLADTFEVTVEPVNRIGGGFDLVVRARDEERG